MLLYLGDLHCVTSKEATAQCLCVAAGRALKRPTCFCALS